MPAPPPGGSAGQLRLIIVTGLSGSGKTTALRVLEDLGFFCIDNLPPALLPKFVELCQASAEISRAALGIDVRGREFLRGYRQARDAIDALGLSRRPEVLFLDSADDVLVRRFSETRRRHPLAGSGDLRDGIRLERDLLGELRDSADALIDTSQLNVHQLKELIIERYGAGQRRLAINLLSFGFKYGVPPEADMILDVRFLPNPFFVDELKRLTGTDEPVARYVLAADGTTEFLEHAMRLLDFVLPRYEREGKSYATIGIGCTGGRHRSVVVAEELARRLGKSRAEGDEAQSGAVVVTCRHRDMEKA
jgi:UPF0042 nucleotide-binding protein